MKELVIGAGNSKTKHLYTNDDKYTSPIYLDIDETSNPDVLWDLNDRPLPFDDEEFDEIHAYEVLEHVGKQGDWQAFFEEFEEYFRVLKPKGKFYGSCPSISSPWLWGDPGHTRVICTETFTFLSQKEYEIQVGKTSMTDYRDYYKGDFTLIHSQDDGENFFFVLERQ